MRSDFPSAISMAALVAAFMASVTVTPSAMAADSADTLEVAQAAQAPPPSDWAFAFTPYAWLMGVNGSMTAKGMTMDVNANVVDLLQHSDTLYGFMGTFEARKREFSFYLDAVYTFIGGSSSASVDRTPFPRVNLSATANATVSNSMLIGELGGGYELWNQKEGAGSSAIDAIVGVRYYRVTADLSADVNVDVSRTARFISFDVNRSRATASAGVLNWADPFIGIRLRDKITERHRVDLQGDIGGFGIGSYLAWQLRATYSYTFSAGRTSWEALLGYRALGINYASSTGDGMNAVFHGPMIGVTARF